MPHLDQNPLFTLSVTQEMFDFNKVKNKITDLLVKSEEFFSNVDIGYLDSKEQSYFLANRMKLKQVKNMDYSDLRVKTIAVPPGLKAPYVDYVGTLLEGSEIVKDIHSRVLEPYARWLSININDPSNLTSARGVDIAGFKPANIDGVYNDMSAMFKKGNDTNQGLLGEYFARTTDIVTVGTANTAISDLVLGMDRKDVLNKVSEITYYLEKLHSVLIDDDAVPMSPTVTKMLSKITYTVAREVEFMGVMHYNYKSFNTAYESVIKSL